MQPTVQLDGLCSPIGNAALQEWTFPNKKQWNVINVTSRLGCVRVAAGMNFPLKHMEMYAEYGRSPLPYVAEFSNYTYINSKFQNPRILWSLLEPRGTKCVRVVRRETELLSMHNWSCESTCRA